jgi:hypothetical protein
MQRSFLLLVIPCAVLLAACKRDTNASTTAQPGSSSPRLPPKPSEEEAAVASTASASPQVDPVGVATLVIQRVDSDCGEGPKGRNFLGYDVLIASKLDAASDAGDKSAARPITCPPRPLNLWRMCQRYTRCRVADDAGDDRIAVTCDNDTFVLESTPAGTRVAAPGGITLDVAPGPMRLTPVKKTQRYAMVDC